MPEWEKGENVFRIRQVMVLPVHGNIRVKLWRTRKPIVLPTMVELLIIRETHICSTILDCYRVEEVTDGLHVSNNLHTILMVQFRLYPFPAKDQNQLGKLIRIS